MKITTAFWLLAGSLGLAACGGNDDAASPQAQEQPAAGQQAAVPEDNVFHDQVDALNKAKAAKQAQEQRQEDLDKAIQEQTGSTTDDPART